MITTILLFFQKIGTWELILILAVVLLLFGGRKVPELMRNLGKGMGEFKKGLKEGEDEYKKSKNDENEPQK